MSTSTKQSPRGVLLGILGGSVPPGSPNPDPISDQKMSFSVPVFRPGLWAKIMISLELTKKNPSNPFLICIFLFLSYLFGIETINTFMHSCSFLENHTRFQTKNWQNLYPFQTKKAQKPYPFGQHISILLI